MRRPILLTGALAITLVLGAVIAMSFARRGWSAQERAVIESLWIGSLGPLPPDPSNRFGDDPRAAALGEALFFDTRLSSNGEVACATCHQPELGFLDGLPTSVGVGEMPRKSMTIVGTAYSPWLFWDGRKDSLWAQALGPLESPVEHGISRARVVHTVAAHHREPYEAVFGPLPDVGDAERFPLDAGPLEDAATRAAWEAMAPEDRAAVTAAFVNVGKAIAAFERTIMPGPARFDAYAEAVVRGDDAAARAMLSADEVAGLRLFIGDAGCIDCHSGPLLTTNEFHNTGVPAVAGLPADHGRALGARQVLEDEFNCLSASSDAAPSECVELRFLKADGHELERAFRPPTLRGVAEAAPYMHAGQFGTLREVLEHYDRAPAAPSGHSELRPLRLSERQLGQLEAFLRTLSAPAGEGPTPESQPSPRARHPRFRPAVAAWTTLEDPQESADTAASRSE